MVSIVSVLAPPAATLEGDAEMLREAGPPGVMAAACAAKAKVAVACSVNDPAAVPLKWNDACPEASNGTPLTVGPQAASAWKVNAAPAGADSATVPALG